MRQRLLPLTVAAGLAGPCGPVPDLTIMEIQGTGERSPYEGHTVQTAGVVTLLRADGEGFWLQDRVGDGDASTSDGIFVAESAPAVPRVGDRLRIVADVVERQSGRALPRTELARVRTLEILSGDNPVPDTVELIDLPDEVLGEGIAFWEPLEGMRVRVRNGVVVSPTSRHGELALLAEADARPGSGFSSRTGHMFPRSLGPGRVDYNPERILVDDESLEKPVIVRPGDQVGNLVGVVDYTFGNYKIQPGHLDVEARPAPASPVSRRSGDPGDTVVTTFNVENLFDLQDEPDKDDASTTPTPEELETKLAKLALAFQQELRLPEIVVVQEVENTAILERLAKRIDRAAKTRYRATSLGSSDRRGIEVGFLWDAARVGLREAFLLSGPEVEAAFGPGSASPGREPLVGIFEIGERELVVVGNHFKSKGGDDPLFGVNDPPLRPSEDQRKAQARVVRGFVDSVLTDNPHALVLVAGDLNDFPFGEPGEGRHHPLAILEAEGGPAPLTNLVSVMDGAEAYTFVFDGNSEVLDYLLVSPALAGRVAAVDVLHFNAAFPAALASNPATPLRASDHDPVEARFWFR
ncbi:MAG: hypothetical protein ACE5JI_01430 [Acidobacteriota bacterium]